MCKPNEVNKATTSYTCTYFYRSSWSSLGFSYQCTFAGLRFISISGIWWPCLIIFELAIGSPDLAHGLPEAYTVLTELHTCICNWCNVPCLPVTKQHIVERATKLLKGKVPEYLPYFSLHDVVWVTLGNTDSKSCSETSLVKTLRVPVT